MMLSEKIAGENERSAITTRIIEDPADILTRAKFVTDNSKALWVCSSLAWLRFLDPMLFESFSSVLQKQKKGEHQGIRWIGPIRNREDALVSQKFLQLGMEIRHFDNIPLNFSVTDKEFNQNVISPLADVNQSGKGALPRLSTLATNDPLYIEHFRRLFREMWDNAVPAEQRIKEIEQGIEHISIEILSDRKKTQAKYEQLVSSAESEILLFLPSTNAFHREERFGIIRELERAAEERNVRVNVLSSIDEEIKKRLEHEPWNSAEERESSESENDSSMVISKIQSGKGQIRFRETRADLGPKVTIIVADRKMSLVVELKDDTQAEFQDAIGLATFSNSKSTIDSYVAFFGKLWRESELREHAERARRQAELLQDILTHDIRNYTQVTKLSAEILGEELKGNKQVETVVQNQLASIDGMTLLLDRTKKLGKVMSETEPNLFSVDLVNTVQETVALIRKGSMVKNINHRLKILSSERSSSSAPQKEEIHPQVYADELLEDVFVNLYSNSLKHRSEEEPLIETVIEKVQPKDLKGNYWQVSVIDNGGGISDEMKKKAFSRFRAGAKGTGLGLSIVYALVVERYRGRIDIKDRISGDYTKGTRVEFLLPEASQSPS